MSSISQFKDTFRGGVRPNQFYVRFYNLPESIGGLTTGYAAGGGFDGKFTMKEFLVKS